MVHKPTRARGQNLAAFRDPGIEIYLRQVAKTTPLSAKEECALAALIQKGDKAALNKLVLANLRFVISVALTYSHKGLPVEDLINIGNVGLMRAAKRFDGKKNFKFVSYAVWWIRQAILKALADQSRIVRLPIDKAGLVYKIEKAKQKILQRKNHNATIHEIADETGVATETINYILQATSGHVSFDAPIDDGKATLHDKIPEDNHSQSESSADTSLSREIEKSLAWLDEREREIVCLYFGIGNDTDFTLDEIGQQLNLSRERVRQIKGVALKKLQAPVLSRNLKDFHLQ